MDRYDREERSYDRGGRDRPESEPPDSPGDFPWQEAGAGDRPPEVWEELAPEQPSGPGATGVASGIEGTQRNPLAITGFVLSLVMWIALPVPALSFVLWILALTFSSIGLSRSRRLEAPYKGLAIAGLCISLVGVVILIVFILFLVGLGVASSV